MFQLFRSLARPDHDFNKFSTGNKITLETEPGTLGINVRDELLKFHSEFYSSNAMGCCVLGKEDLDTLQNMVVPLLENVPNKNVCVPEWKEPPFTESELQRIIYSPPIKDKRYMSVVWPIPDMSTHYKQGPVHYLGHLIGHEGQGSLLSELKSRGWVNVLSAGHALQVRGFAFFEISVDLTVEGQEHTDEIVRLIYQYIQMLREVSPQSWIFDECNGISAMNFNFKASKEDPSGYTSALSRRLQRLPIEDVLSAHALYDSSFNPRLVNDILDRLTPQNMIVELISKKFEKHTDRTEHWYGTPYKLSSFSEEQVDMWTHCKGSQLFHLPRPNNFIPTDFTLVKQQSLDAAVSPTMVKNSPFSRLWFKQDSQFLQPKLCVSVDLKNSLAYKTPLNVNLNYLFQRLFNDSVAELSYDAALAGLSYGLSATISGLRLEFGGYNHKMMAFIRLLTNKLTMFTVDDQRLDIFIEELRRSLKNFAANQPYQQASYYTSLLTSEVVWTQGDLLSSLEDVNAERLQSYAKESLSKVFLEGLIYGNIDESQSLEILQMIEDILIEKCGTEVLPQYEISAYRALKLPDGCSFLKKETNTVHDNYATMLYFQCGKQDTESNMLLGLFCQLISEPCFNILRTQEQLGYIVSSGPRRSEGVQGFKVIVQSSRDSDYVESRIEAFINHVGDIISGMPDDTFETHKQALIINIQEKPKTMRGQHSIFLSEITSNFYNFHRDEVEVEFLRTLTKQDILHFYQEHIAPNASFRRKLAVHVEPEFPGDREVIDDNEENKEFVALKAPDVCLPVRVSDVSQYKQGLECYPSTQPVIDIKAAF